MKTVKKRKIIFIAGVLSIILFFTILLVIIVSKNLKKDYFVINSRVSDVENTKILKNFSSDSQVVGWIRIQGTNIDYPIVHNSKWSYPVNEKYYAKMQYYTPGFHNHFEVSGHNILNLSSTPKMHAEGFNKFEELMSFVYYDFAKENKYIQLTYEKKDYIYKIFAVAFIPTDVLIGYKSNTDFNKEDFDSYLNIINDYNIYQYDVDISTEDKILSLSTCTRFFGSNKDWNFYVIGRLLRNHEKIDNYNIKPSSNYDEIDSRLKGDEYDEEI